MSLEDPGNSAEYIANCMFLLERFYGTDRQLYQDVEDCMVNMYAMYGKEGIALVMSFAAMCRDYNELRRLFSYVTKFIERYGIENAFPLAELVATYPGAFQLRKMRLIYKIICRDIYSDRFTAGELGKLFGLAERLGLSDENFEIFIDLIIDDDMKAAQELLILMTQYPALWAARGIARNCAVLLGSGEFDVARLYIRVWEAAACPPEMMDALANKLIGELKRGETAVAKRALREFLGIKR